MNGLRELDRVLRGEPGEDRPLKPLARICLALAALAGVCVGVYGLFRPDGPEWRQLLASSLKVPALLFLTLVVTFPSLYVFNTLLGPRLGLARLARVVFSGLGVLVAVLSAFGPIVAFFSVTTPSYYFVLLLNVAVFAVAGLFGMAFLHRALLRASTVDVPPAQAPPAPPSTETPPPAATETPPFVPPKPSPSGLGCCRANPVFYVWMLLFSVVGAQMAWVLRPFIGAPDLPFTWLRTRQSSFFEAVWNLLWTAFGG